MSGPFSTGARRARAWRAFPWRTLLALALIAAAVLIPGDDLPDGPGIPGLDKLVHFCLFALLALMARRDFRPRGWMATAFALLLATTLATGTELVQLAVPGRSTELADAIADLAGFAAGWFLRSPAARLAARVLTKKTR